MSNFYVYFNDQKQITSISGRKNKELTDRFGTFPREEVVDFMNGNKSFVNYQIVENRKTGKIRIEKKKTNEVVVQTLDDKLYKIQPLTTEHYDVKIIIDYDIMHITLHENIRKELLGDASDITINGATTLQFFITKKDDPHFLKKEIIIDIINLIKQDITVDCTPLGEFSIYTKRVYEDYCYEIRR